MSRQIQIRRGTSEEHETFTGAVGEITMDTTNKTLRVHDGETAGGTVLAKDSDKININASNISETGKNYISSLSLPSNRYIDLVLTNNPIYTAPANGYYTYSDQAQGPGIAKIINLSNGLASGCIAPSATWIRSVYLPVSEGDQVNVIVEYPGEENRFKVFRFIYANDNANS